MTEHFVQETMQAWQPYYEQELSQREGEEIAANWGAFLNVVSGWADIISHQESSNAPKNKGLDL